MPECRCIFIAERISFTESSGWIYLSGQNVQHRARPRLTGQISMQDRFTAIMPRHFDRRACAEQSDYIFIDLNDRLQKFDLVLRDPHMGTIHPLRFAQLIQSETIQNNIRRCRQIQRLFFHRLVRFSGPFVASVDPHDLKIVIADHFLDRFQIGRIYHRRSGSLISGFHRKISDHSNLTSCFQR